MIPQFPQFKKIELTDRVDVEAHTSLFEPYSDFEFTCLWAWDMKEERMISELDGNLVVKFTDYNTHKHFLSFLGTHDCERTARTLIDYCKANNLPTTLKLMPDVSISNISQTMFTVEESPGDFDYIYSVEKLAQLAGNDFYGKRRYANRFWRDNPSARLIQINLCDKEIQKKILEIIAIWENNKVAMKKEYDIDHELSATKRIFRSDCIESLIGMGFYCNEAMIGFAIGENISNIYSVIHFIKCDISYKGSNEALMQGFAKHLNSLSIKWINFESDLEIENMRNSKMSWKPVKFLKRYNVQYAQT